MTLDRLAVTTAANSEAAGEGQAQQLAEELGGIFVPRSGRSLSATAQAAQATQMLIVEHKGLRLLHTATGTAYVYHPNLLPVRAASLRRGAPDLFLQAAALTEGDLVLDCTLGFGTEATLVSLLVGPSGGVLGLESKPALAAVSRAGMQSPPLVLGEDLAAAMRRVRVLTADYQTFLLQTQNQSFDVVCFDPFFEARLPGSENSVSPLALFGDARLLDFAALQQARRVARKRVVLKFPKSQTLPAELIQDIQRVVKTHKSRVVFYVFAPSVD